MQNITIYILCWCEQRLQLAVQIQAGVKKASPFLLTTNQVSKCEATLILSVDEEMVKIEESTRRV